MVGDTLYAGDHKGWFAVNLNDGRPLWYTPSPTPDAAPILQNGKLYGTSHHSLIALNAANGSKLWEHTFAHRLSGQPALGDNFFYCASMEGMIYRVSLP